MKQSFKILFVWVLILVGGGLFSACRTSPDFDPYEVFVPEDEIVATPAPVTPPPVETSDDVQEEAPKKKRGWLSFLRRDAEAQNDVEEAVTAADVSEGIIQKEPMGELVNPAVLPDRYLLRVNDQLQIHITGSGLDEQLEMPVDENGEITLRFIGRVRAVGLSLSQLEREIELEYTERQRIYREVFVRVNVPYTFYFIGGEVRQPGRYPITGRVTLSQAIVSAGNFTEWARRDGRLILVRNNERIVVDFRDILADPTKDIDLRTGDVITVERSFL